MSVLPSAESRNMRIIGHNDLAGQGDGSQISIVDDFAYIGHMGTHDAGTSIVHIGDPTKPRLVAQIPRPPYTMTHKTQILGDLLLVNHQRSRFESGPDGAWSAGLAVYDISKRSEPKQIGFYEAPGDGIHRTGVDGERYAYASRTDVGFAGRFLAVIDLVDPTNPTEVGRCWVDGQHTAAGEEPVWDPTERDVKLHHGLPVGDRLYCGWGDGGFVTIDIADPTAPKVMSRLDLGSASSDTHTALKVPGRDLVLVVDEVLKRTIGQRREVWVVDVSDEMNPEPISVLPPPASPDEYPGERFGPHNLHEMRPGTFVSSDIVYLTYFAGGLRAYDLSDPRNPEEVASCVPESPHGRDGIEINDVVVNTERIAYITDRHAGGLYVIQHD
jgi:hypothetical protein